MLLATEFRSAAVTTGLVTAVEVVGRHGVDAGRVGEADLDGVGEQRAVGEVGVDPDGDGHEDADVGREAGNVADELVGGVNVQKPGAASAEMKVTPGGSVSTMRAVEASDGPRLHGGDVVGDGLTGLEGPGRCAWRRWDFGGVPLEGLKVGESPASSPWPWPCCCRLPGRGSGSSPTPC